MGSKCQLKNNVEVADMTTETVDAQNDSDSLNQEILTALNTVSSRSSTIEQRIDMAEEQLHDRSSCHRDIGGMAGESLGLLLLNRMIVMLRLMPQYLIPSMHFLKNSRQIQEPVDERLKELMSLNEKGTFKAQRGGNEQTQVKYQVPCPQNHILAGTSKNRVSYDSLSIFQLISGFCSIIKEENSVKIKKYNAGLYQRFDV